MYINVIIQMQLLLCVLFTLLFYAQEELVDTLAREKERTVKELILVIFIRIGTNLFVLLSLVGAGAAIYYSAVFELQLVS